MASDLLVASRSNTIFALVKESLVIKQLEDLCVLSVLPLPVAILGI